VKPVAIHKAAQKVIRGFSKPVRLELGSALFKVQLGMSLGSRRLAEMLSDEKD
jgi:hypothetical protein